MRAETKSALRAIMLMIPVAAAFSVSAAPPSDNNLFCCTDPSGRHVCGNPLPAACYNRAYRELSHSGRTTREVAAPLTAEERLRKEAADRTARDAETRAAELRRRDKALLDSYPSVAALDERRTTVLAASAKEIDLLRRRETLLLTERKQLAGKLAATKTKPPRTLQDDLAATDSELVALRAVIAQKQRDYDTQKMRFDEDRRRYIELSGQSPAR